MIGAAGRSGMKIDIEGFGVSKGKILHPADASCIHSPGVNLGCSS